VFELLMNKQLIFGLVGGLGQIEEGIEFPDKALVELDESSSRTLDLTEAIVGEK